MICYYCGDDTKHLNEDVIITCNGCYTSYCIGCYDKLYKDPNIACICEYKHESKEKLMVEYDLNDLDELIAHHNSNCDHAADCQYFEGQCEVDDKCECYVYYYIGLCPQHDINERELPECIFCTSDPKKRFYTDSELLYFALSILKINKKDLLDKAIELELMKDV
jgi:hypothetical protein